MRTRGITLIWFLARGNSIRIRWSCGPTSWSRMRAPSIARLTSGLISMR